MGIEKCNARLKGLRENEERDGYGGEIEGGGRGDGGDEYSGGGRRSGIFLNVGCVFQRYFCFKD